MVGQLSGILETVLSVKCENLTTGYINCNISPFYAIRYIAKDITIFAKDYKLI